MNTFAPTPALSPNSIALLGYILVAEIIPSGVCFDFYSVMFQGSTIRKRKMYEEFLSKVPILGRSHHTIPTYSYLIPCQKHKSYLILPARNQIIPNTPCQKHKSHLISLPETKITPNTPCQKHKSYLISLPETQITPNTLCQKHKSYLISLPETQIIPNIPARNTNHT